MLASPLHLERGCSSQSAFPPVTFKGMSLFSGQVLHPRRWLLLFVFCFASGMSALISVTFAPIAAELQRYYGAPFAPLPTVQRKLLKRHEIQYRSGPSHPGAMKGRRMFYICSASKPTVTTQRDSTPSVPPSRPPEAIHYQLVTIHHY